MSKQTRLSDRKKLRLVFQGIQSKESFRASLKQDGEIDFTDDIIKAAIAKCLEFNLASSTDKKSIVNPFLFVSNLRGICEDLIVITYAVSLGHSDAKELFRKQIALNFAKCVLTQRMFFEANNPSQPIYGGLTDISELEANVNAAQADLSAFWKTRGGRKKNGPSVKDMSRDVGLETTYSYIYFLSSNFVHFNVNALLRTGWGPPRGPFTYSTSTMSKYYEDLSILYGTMLFIGFYNAFSPLFFDNNLDAEISALIDYVADFGRWPEIVTFEELNQKLPSPIIHAIYMTRAKENAGSETLSLMAEIRNLRGKGQI
jgi:hypothetical protein